MRPDHDQALRLAPTALIRDRDQTFRFRDPLNRQRRFIPLRLDECRVPAQIARQVQYIDMFPDWDAGRRRLLRVMRGARSRPRAA